MTRTSTIRSTVIPLPIENVDTDQIIPARYLKKTSMDGFGEALFRDWRYDSNNTLKEDFVLNNETYRGNFLVAGHNFGCGSSREHAVWALQQYGFQAVISSAFADIFKQNALNNGLLPIEVSQDFLETLFYLVEQNPATQIRINLLKQIVDITEVSLSYHFEMDPFKKENILQGMDDLEYLLRLDDQIKEFEKNQVLH